MRSSECGMRSVGRCLVLGMVSLAAYGQEHHVGHEDQQVVNKPRVYLDKSPRIVEYQLKRLSNAQLLLVDRLHDDPKYAPVYNAILLRFGMSLEHREEALTGLLAINGTTAVDELLRSMQGLDLTNKSQDLVFGQLSTLLLGQPSKNVRSQRTKLVQVAQSDDRSSQIAGLAGLLGFGFGDAAWELATSTESATLAYLDAVDYLPQPELRTKVRPQVVSCLDQDQPEAVQLAAIGTLAGIPSEATDSFFRIRPFVDAAEFRGEAVRGLLTLPKTSWPGEETLPLLRNLVEHVESIPAAQRTTDEELDGLQLADNLLAMVGVAAARSLRERLRKVTVRVVQINTVHEEMRFDKPFFAVEAGRPVQIVLRNEDAMPHNLVVTMPGMLREVAQLAGRMGSTPGSDGKQYVPESDEVLFATGMVQPDRQERLVFDAPAEAGEYPYVCTFPQHWMRMYGVMVVVPDLDEWSKDPQPPADPLGNTRTLVQSWKLNDLTELAQGLRGRTSEIGKRLFAEATCAQCHNIKAEGGAVGPDLTEVLQRWKGDHQAVLREILEPSYKVDPKFAMQTIVTVDGQVMTGVVTAQDARTLTIVTNPEDPRPQVITRRDIDEIVQSTTSMMPKGLLDRFTRDEIFEILSYVSGPDR
jgi:putative heme-binding domain-containing protein